MTPLAIALVLAAAVVHAVWNLSAKRAGGGAPFVWLMFLCSAIFYLPVAVAAWVVLRPHFGPQAWLFVAGTSLWHVAYFVLLQRGYRSGDLSVVYPLARGTGPLLTALVAAFALGEHPTAIGWTGIVLVLGGIFVFAGDPRRLAGAHGRTVGYALWTGVTIAIYTLWDQHAVTALAISPLIYDFFGNVGRTLVLAPLALRRRSDVLQAWRVDRGAVLTVAVLSPLAYLLVLFAMRLAPVAYVAPARELSVVIGALFGVRVLEEGHALRRVLAACAVVLGIAAIAVA